MFEIEDITNMKTKDTELAEMVSNAVTVFTNTEADRKLFTDFILQIFEEGVKRGMDICEERFYAKAN